MGELNKAKAGIPPEPQYVSPTPWKLHPNIDGVIVDRDGTMIIECLAIDHLYQRLPASRNARHIISCLNDYKGMEREVTILRSQVDMLRKRLKK